MNSKIENAKAKLINLLCEEARTLLLDGKAHYCGWVDFVGSDLIQYEIVGCFIGVGKSKNLQTGDIILVHQDNSEGHLKGNIMKLKEIKSIDVIENIIKNLK